MSPSLLLANYNNERLLIDGGIGDFLQHLPFMAANRKHPIRYVVATHFQDAERFFEAIGIKPEFIFKFSSLEQQAEVREHLKSLGPLYGFPRAGVFEHCPFAMPRDVFVNDRRTLGVHIGGSAYSIGVQKRFGLVSKALPEKLIESLLSAKLNILVFGSREETGALKLAQSDTLKFIDFADITKSLSYVARCFAVVAGDSAIKTMSAMLKIPTLVWLGDYRDDPRDQMFIDPYVKAGIMTVYRYKNLKNDAEFDAGIQFTKRFLERISASG